MATQFEAAIAQGAIDITNKWDRYGAPKGFRVIVMPRPRGFAPTQTEIDKAMRHGHFPFSQFIGTFMVSNIGAFNEEKSKSKVLAAQKLAPATITALRKQGIISRPGTRAGLPEKSAPISAEQKSLEKQQKTDLAHSLVRVFNIPSKQAIGIIQKKGFEGTVNYLNTQIAVNLKKQQEEAEKKALSDLSKTGAIPISKDTSKQFLTDFNKALVAAQAPKITAEVKQNLSDYSRQTGASQVNAAFLREQINRNQFISLINNAQQRANFLRQEQAKANAARVTQTKAKLFDLDLQQKTKALLNSVKSVPVTPKVSLVVKQSMELDAQAKAIENANKKLEVQAKELDRRIKVGVATNAEIVSFNAAAKQLNSKADSFNDKVTSFEKKTAPSVVANMGELTVKDFFGSRATAELKEVQRGTAQFFQDVFKTKGFSNRKVESQKNAVLRELGSGVGTALQGLNIFQKYLVFGGQETSKLMGFRKAEIILSKDLADFVKYLRSVDVPIITNPLKFVEVSGNKFVVRPRAIGEAGGLVGDIAMLLLPGGKVNLVKLNKAGKVSKIVGTVSKTSGKPTLSFFNNTKLDDFAKIINKKPLVVRKLEKIPEIKALIQRVGFEAKELKKFKKGVVTDLTKTQKAIVKRVNDKIAIKMKPVNTIIQKQKVGLKIKAIEVERSLEPFIIYKIELTNLAKKTIDEKTSAFVNSELKSVKTFLDNAKPSLIKKGNFNQFARLKEAQRKMSNGLERLTTMAKVSGRKISTKVDVTTSKFNRRVSNFQKKADRLFATPIRGKVRSLKTDYDSLLRNINSEIFRAKTKVMKGKLGELRKQVVSKRNIIDNYFKVKKELSKIDAFEVYKNPRKTWIKKDVANLETQIFGTTAELKIAKSKLKKLVKEKATRLKEKVSLRPSSVKARRVVSRFNNIANKGLKDISILINSVPLRLRAKLKRVSSPIKNDITKFRNALVKKIKGEKLSRLEKIKSRGMKDLSIKEQATRFENSVKKGLRKIEDEKDELLEAVKEVEKLTAKRVAKKSKLIQIKKRLAESRGLSYSGLQRSINSGKQTPKKLDLLIRDARKMRRITKTQANELYKLTLEKSILKAKRIGDAASITVKRAALTAKETKAYRLLRKLAEKNKRVARLTKKEIQVASKQADEVSKLIGKNNLNKFVKENRLLRKFGKIERREMGIKKFASRRAKARVKRRVDIKTKKMDIKTKKMAAREKASIKMENKAMKKFVKDEGRKQRKFMSQKNWEKSQNLNKVYTKAQREAIATKKEWDALRLQRKISRFERKKVGKVDPWFAAKKKAKNRQKVFEKEMRMLDEKKIDLERDAERIVIQQDLLRGRKPTKVVIRKMEVNNITLGRIGKKYRKVLSRQKGILKEYGKVRVKPMGVKTFKVKKVKPRVKGKPVEVGKGGTVQFGGTVQIQRTKTKPVTVQIQRTKTKPVVKARLKVKTKSKVKLKVFKRRKVSPFFKLRAPRSKFRLVPDDEIVYLRGRPPIHTPRVSQVLLNKIKIPAYIAAKAVALAFHKQLQKVDLKIVGLNYLRMFDIPKLKYKVLFKHRSVFIYAEAMKTRLRFSEAEAMKTRLRLAEAMKTRLRFSEAEKLKFKEKERMKFAEKVKIVTKPKISLKPRITTKLKIKTRPRITTKLKITTKPPIKIKRPPKVPLIPKLKIKVDTVSERFLRSKISVKAVIRVRGKDVIVNQKPLRPSAALALAHRFIENHPARSFRLVRARGKPVKISLKSLPRKQYRQPKGKTKLARSSLVEKSKYAINTRGEKKGITLKGIGSRIRNKKVRRVLNPVLFKKKKSKKLKRTQKGSSRTKKVKARLGLRKKIKSERNKRVVVKRGVQKKSKKKVKKKVKKKSKKIKRKDRR